MKNHTLVIAVTAILVTAAIISLSIFSNESLDCIERMCLGVIALAGGVLVAIGVIYVFDEAYLDVDLSDMIGELVPRASKNSVIEESVTERRGFRPSYYDSKNKHERAVQREQRSIQELIRQIDAL